MLTIIGTVPLEEKIYSGSAVFEGRFLKIGGTNIPVERGTGALIASALRILELFGSDKPYCLLAGDRSAGNGSKLLLEESLRFLPGSGATTLVLHYMFILLKYGEALDHVLRGMKPKPFIIADAGGMYLMKASGKSKLCDVFTPDHGELAFLADSKSAHPMYTNPAWLSHPVEKLVVTAWEMGNIPATLVAKGSSDFVYQNGQKTSQVTEPVVPVMEAIGGTGDTVTGMLAAFQHLQVKDAAMKALLLNRLIGKSLNCNPRTQISEFIDHMDVSLLTRAGVDL